MHSKCNKIYNDKSISARVSEGILNLFGEKIKTNYKNIQNKIFNMSEKVVEKLPKQFTSIIELKKISNMENLHMRIGNQLGEILFQTAQEKIKNGECQKAIELYTDSLHGFTEEYVGKVLRNEMVLVTDEDGVNMNLVDDKELIEKNQSNMYDWWSIVKNEIEYIDELRDYRIEIMEKFHNVCHNNIEDVNIREVMLRYMDEEQLRHYGAYNIAAKLIANKPFSRLASNGEHTWNRICARVENDEAYKYERILYYLVKYNEVMRKLFNTYMKIANTYKFLEKQNNFIEKQ